MSQNLVADIRIAASDPPSTFSDGWGWPVAQTVYDETTRELIENLDRIHIYIGQDFDSLVAFQLIKSELIKELVPLVCALIDASVARQKHIQLVYGTSETLSNMIERDQFLNHSTVDEMRSDRRVGLRSHARSWVSRYRRARGRKRASSGKRLKAISLNVNPLGSQLGASGARSIRFTMSDLIAARSRKISPTQQFTDIADHIVENLVALLDTRGITLSDNAAIYLRQAVYNRFHQGWQDHSIKSQIAGIGAGTTLITATGGAYAAMVIAQQFWKAGASIIRTTHGGDTPLFKEFVWPSIEFPFCSTLIAFGDEAASAINQQKLARSEAGLTMHPKHIEAIGSTAHRSLWQRSPAPGTGKRPERVTVIAASFTGVRRAAPHKKLHDVVYFEWHRRLLASLSAAGFSVLSKRHPKGLLAGRRIFGNVVEELMRQPMTAVEDRTDVYVIDFPGSALIDALCTKKQVVLIDLPVKIMTDDARSSLSLAARIVPAEFDEQNRVTVNFKELEDAINTPVNIEARENFINDYVLRPSTGISNVYDELKQHG